MLKKFMITALIVSLTLSCTACGKKVKETSETPKAATTVKLFANFNPADPAQGDKAFFEKAEKAIGVKLEFDIPPSTSYAERLQLMLTSGEYPDAILFMSTQDQAFLNAVAQGIIVPVNDYIKNAPNIMKYTYDVAWDSLKSKNDDNIYGIPRSSMMRNDGFMIREDWMEKVGLKMPEDHGVTIDEFTEIMKRFTENDPDGNGKKDTYGFIASADSRKKLNPIMIAPFGCYGWQKYPDEPYTYMDLIYSRTNNAYKEALAYTADLYNKGYMEPNAPINTSNDVTDKFYKGTVGGVVPGFSGHLISYETELKKNVPNAKLNYIFVKNKQGEIKGGAFGTGTYGHWAITTAAKDPAAVVKVLDWMMGDDGWNIILKGIQDIDYKMVDGKKVPQEGTKAKWTGMFVRRKGDLEFFTGSSAWTADEKQRVEPIVSIATSSMIFSQDRGYTPPIAKEISYVNYTKTMDEAVTKIAMGQFPVSSYDKALDGWYKNGGEDFIKQMNEYIKRINKEQ